MINRARLRRWHIWLGWLIALPMLFWTVSGLVMVWKPIEEVRGEGLMHAPAPIRLAAPPVAPAVDGMPLKSLSLQPRADGPRWVITLSDGITRLADPATGDLLPRLGATGAVHEVMALYTGTDKVASVSRTDGDHPPLDLRKPVEAWQVTMAGGTHFFVDAGSGEVIAKRTGWWRFYDFMWGWHIMDPGGREDTHNPWIISFTLVAVTTVILALILLPLTIRRRKGQA